MLCGVPVNPKNSPATGCNGWFVVLDIREFILAVTTFALYQRMGLASNCHQQGRMNIL